MKKLLLFLLLLPFSLLAQPRTFVLDPGLSPENYRPHTLLVKFKPKVGKGLLPQNHYAIRQIGGSLKKAFPALDKKLKVNSLRSEKVEKLQDLSQVFFVETDPARTLQESINLLLSDPDVIYAEPVMNNYHPLFIPNDTRFADQYYLNNIQAPAAWDIQTGSPSVISAVIDFGFDVTHEDLVGNMLPGWNIADKNTQLFATDGHGTQAAGIMFATANNAKGIAGIAHTAKFIPIRGSSDLGRGFAGYEGIVYAVDKGCKVINLSWGRVCGGFLQSEQDVIDYAYQNDVVVVASAGNTYAEEYWFPAAYDHLLCVAASNVSEKPMGPGGGYNLGCVSYPFGTTFNDKVDIIAPGDNVLTTFNSSSYNYNSGTSFSSPMVAAAAVLVRSQFPALTAEEVMQRLMATSDDTYNINTAFKGKLGAGRLNVFRAVSETNLKAASVAKWNVSNAAVQPYFLPGTNQLVLEVKNYFIALADLQIKIRVNSPDVTLLDSTSRFGAMDSKTSLANTADPFVISVKPNTPLNTEVVFEVILTDGTYTRTQYFTQNINPDYLDVHVNQLFTLATSKGRFGYNDDNYQVGNGFIYKSADASLLDEAALMVGVSDTKISNAVTEMGYLRNQDFRSVNPIHSDRSNGADFSASGIFTDTAANANAVGLQISHTVYGWKNTPDDKYFIQEYKLKNIGNTDLPDVYAGIYANWDVQGYDKNQADWNDSLKLGYVFNTLKNNTFAGIMLLTDQAPQYYALDYDYKTGVWTYDSFSRAEKFKTISSGVFRKQSTPGTPDVSHVVGGKIGVLPKNTEQLVAFAFVAGNSLDELKTNAKAARNRFRIAKTSPTPNTPQMTVCTGEKAILSPQNGKKFNFYAVGATVPAFTGAAWDLGKISRDTIVEISGMDSLYESQRVKMQVKIGVPQTDFSLTTRLKDTTVIGIDNFVAFSDKSTGSVKWLWDFGDGSKSTEQNPKYSYKVTGKYSVKLTTENASGCSSLMTKPITVLDLTTGVENTWEKSVSWYPNPASGSIFCEKKVAGMCELEIFNLQGGSVHKQTLRAEKEEIRLSHLPGGMYIAKLRSGTQTAIQKIVLQ
jgi:serine protease